MHNEVFEMLVRAPIFQTKEQYFNQTNRYAVLIWYKIKLVIHKNLTQDLTSEEYYQTVVIC